MSKPLPPFPDTSPDAVPSQDNALYEQTAPQQKQRKPMMLIIIIAVIVLLVLVGAGGAYWLTGRHKPAAHTTSTTSPSQPSNQNRASSPTPSPSASTDMTQYTSNGKDLNLSFAYPSDWTVAPPSGQNSGDKSITVTSPTFSTTNSAGKSVTGKVTVSIRPGTAQVSELSDATLVAQDSIQIAYAKPATDQHQYPYLTFVRLSGGNDQNNGFDEVIITGISKFMKGQNLSPESLGQLDPIISARFVTCSTSCDGSSAAALTITNATWQNDPTFMQVLALFESLQLH